MRPLRARVAAGVGALLLLLGWSPVPQGGSAPAQPDGSTPAMPWASRVLCAQSDDGQQRAWISAHDGLELQGWTAAGGAPLLLGRAGLPRFLPDGRFVFEIGRDDGHRLLARTVHVLDPGSLRPRPPRPGERVGRWIAPERAPPPAGVVRVCLDAGHGGRGTGAAGGGLLEKTLALQTALDLAELLVTDSSDTSGGGQWDVLLTRLDDRPVSLFERACMAQAFGAEVVLSLHAEASAATGGTRTLCHDASQPAVALRDRTHARLLQLLPLGDRGVGTSEAWLLGALPAQAVHSSLGVLGQPADAALLSDAGTAHALALAHLFALQDVFTGSVHEPSLFQLIGGGTYGSHGKPTLLVHGSLLPRSLLTLTLLDGASSSSALVFGSWQSRPQPFPSGGWLHAWPADVQLLLSTDAAGGASVSLPWPAGVPSGQPLWLQALVADPFVVPHGATLSDAQQGQTP